MVTSVDPCAVWVIMFAVTVVVKALVWAGAVVNILAEEFSNEVVIKALIDLMVDLGVGTLTDVKIIVVDVVAVVL